MKHLLYVLLKYEYLPVFSLLSPKFTAYNRSHLHCLHTCPERETERDREREQDIGRFGPTPCSPGEGSKGQISLNFKVNFKEFYTKLCVYSHKYNINHIERDFHSVASVMSQGWDLGCWGQNFIEHGHVAYQIKGDDE